MSRQDNSSSDKSSSKSQVDLYEKAKDLWTQEIQGLLDNMIDGVKDISDWLLTAKEIDHLAKQVTDKKGSIKSSFAFQLRKNLNDFKNMRRTRSHKDMAQGWRGTDSLAREGAAQNPELKSIIKQYSEEYFDINATLFQRLQVCVSRSGVEEKENPVSVHNLCFSFRNSIDSLNLETKYEAALFRYFASKILSNLTHQYRKIDDLLVKHGILLDSKPAGSTPEISHEANSKKSPVPKEFKAKNKNPKNLSELKPPESIVISRNFELLSLLQAYKKNTQFASSRFINVLTDLKQKLTTLKITNIDKEVDHVSFLFNFVFGNKDLADEIKAQLARLQIYVLLSAMNETGFLDNSSNPAHLLIDTVIEAEVDLAESGRNAQSGSQVLKNGIDQLIEKRKVTLSSYSELLNQYQKHIDGLQQQAQSEELKEKLNEENRQKQNEKARLEKDAEKQRLKVIEEERLKKAAEELQLKKTKEEQRLKKIEEAHQKKATEEQQLKKTEEQQRLKKIEEARLKRVAEEQRLKQIEENKRLKELEEQERLKKDREEELKKQTRENEIKVNAEQTVKFKRLVRSTIEEITIPLLALNKSFILFDKVWSPLLLQIALADGIKSSIWEKTVRMVRSQVWSLIPKSTAKDLQTLIAIQPHISNSLVRGMHSLKLSNSLQKSLSEYLRLEFEEVIKQSNLNFRTAINRTPANAAKRPLRPVAGTNKPGDTDNNKPGAKSTASKDDSEDSLIHNSEDLHFYDSHNTFNDDSEDLVIDDADDLIIEDSEELIIEDSSEDTIVAGSEDMIIDDIEDFSASMETGIYQLSSEMLQALNSVTPVGNKKKSGTSTADSIKKGDWVEIKQGSKRIMAKLSWRAADNSLFIFVDDGGKRLKEIDGTTLNGEIESGSMKLVKNSSLMSTNSQFSVVSSPEK